jgi:diacylglycerol O-acyltransferase / wax synthase
MPRTMAEQKLSLQDAMFLANETRESMMHVGGLSIFSAPPDAGPSFLRQWTDDLKEEVTVHPPWTLKLRTPELLKNPLQSWVEDEAFDLDYHVRRSALPSPGGERELGILVSRLHSVQMDFHRPLWELHFIEGLEGGRFALYFKIHHALVDGYTAMKLLARSLSTDPDERHTPWFFARPPRARSQSSRDEPVPSLGAMLAQVREQLRAQTGAMRDVGRAVMNVVRAARSGDRTLITPLHTPRSLLNRRISRNRRFATQQYPTERLRRIAKAAGGTINDVALALCGASLRRLLLELDALPERPLTAMVPVNVRPKDDPGGGNAVAAILASLATDVEDPVERLRAIIASTQRAKEQLQGLSRNAILQYSALLLAPIGLMIVPGVAGRVRPTFNVIVSNVPGPETRLYFRGARLEATYPLSIPFHGCGVNITISGYAETLNFGFIGCRDVLPRMQRLAVYSGEALDELERALA